LKPENSKYEPIEASGDEVEVIGKLIGIYRKVV
jgi:SOS-response transcriptional repressor LexA